MDFEVSTNKGTDILLAEILAELRTSRGLLEKAVQLLSEAAQHSSGKDSGKHANKGSPSSHLRPVSDLPEVLRERLANKGVRITEALGLSSRNAVENERIHLAYFIGRHYTVARRIIPPLRSSFQSPRVVDVDLSDLDEDSLSVATNIANRLKHLGMLSLCEYTRSPRRLRLQVQSKSQAQSYLTGGWFELYVAQVVQKTLSNKLRWIGRNVKCVDTDESQCEVDVLFFMSSGARSLLVAIECKSVESLRMEDCQRVSRRHEILGVDNSLIVLPFEVEASRSLSWEIEAGANVVGASQLSDFLRSL